MKGSLEAKAQTLTYLDSHIEAGIGWLEPLLHRIAEEPKVNKISFNWKDFFHVIFNSWLCRPLLTLSTTQLSGTRSSKRTWRGWWTGTWDSSGKSFTRTRGRKSPTFGLRIQTLSCPEVSSPSIRTWVRGMSWAGETAAAKTNTTSVIIAKQIWVLVISATRVQSHYFSALVALAGEDS